MALPAQLTSFVGRHAEPREITAALAGARLVTLAGPGGCGKTRLAVEAARQAADRWSDPYWIDLTAVTGPAAVPGLAADAFGVLVSGDAAASLTRQIRDRRMLVCLDNCEHVLPAAADLAAAILRGCPDATVLATSREHLAVPGEVVWRVPPLQVDDAVALFNARAGRAGEDNAVRTACLRLDGMPLAVELAAAWSGTLSPEQILADLDDRFGLLIRGPRGVAARHQTLAASMAWSHDLLDESDRVLFRRLGVFHGGFTAAAAEGIGGTRDGLRRLIEKSLLIADTRGSVARYRMLETVREYALSRLPDRAEAQDRHLDVYLATAESVRHLLDQDKDAWRAAIEADYENFRAAIDWGLAQDDAERGRKLAAELAWFWHSSRRGREGLDRLRRAVERAPEERTALQARLLTGLALVADTTQPRELEHAALDIATEVGDADTARLAQLLTGIGLLATDFDQAWQLASEVEQTGDGFVRDAARALMGIVCHLRYEHERAMVLLQAAADGLVPRRDRGVAATALGHLAISTACTGDVRRAHDLAREAVRVAAPLGDYHRVGSAHCVLAQIEQLAGRLDAAWAALDPVLRLVDGAEPAPFNPRAHRPPGPAPPGQRSARRGAAVLPGRAVPYPVRPGRSRRRATPNRRCSSRGEAGRRSAADRPPCRHARGCRGSASRPRGAGG